MLSQLQSPSSSRSSSTSEEPVRTPRSPNSKALLQQDLQNINEMTLSLLADKTAAEQRFDDLVSFAVTAGKCVASSEDFN